MWRVAKNKVECPCKRNRKKRDPFAYVITIFCSVKYIFNQLATSIEWVTSFNRLTKRTCAFVLVTDESSSTGISGYKSHVWSYNHQIRSKLVKSDKISKWPEKQTAYAWAIRKVYIGSKKYNMSEDLGEFNFRATWRVCTFWVLGTTTLISRPGEIELRSSDLSSRVSSLVSRPTLCKLQVTVLILDSNSMDWELWRQCQLQQGRTHLEADLGRRSSVHQTPIAS